MEKDVSENELHSGYNTDNSGPRYNRSLVYYLQVQYSNMEVFYKRALWRMFKHKDGSS
jgi:hypothetical protein